MSPVPLMCFLKMMSLLTKSVLRSVSHQREPRSLHGMPRPRGAVDVHDNPAVRPDGAPHLAGRARVRNLRLLVLARQRDRLVLRVKRPALLRSVIS